MVKITDNIIAQYTEGDCWILALALHEMTSWPYVLIGDWREGSELFDWDHVAVQPTSETLLDVRGESLLTDELNLGYGTESLVVDQDEYDKHVILQYGDPRGTEWFDLQLTIARVVAEEVLRAYEAHPALPLESS